MNPDNPNFLTEAEWEEKYYKLREEYEEFKIEADKLAESLILALGYAGISGQIKRALIKYKRYRDGK